MRKTYVIGLSQINLLNIGWELNLHKGKAEVSHIVHGLTCVYDVTPFDDLDAARDTIKEIQGRYDQIIVRRENIVESLVHGNDFDPMQLHIYEVRVGWEVK